MKVSFAAPGSVRGKGRPRFVAGRSKPFTHPATASYERYIAECATEAMAGRPPIEGPVSLDMAILLLVPASWSAARRAAADYATSKPDLDNVVKLFKDAMNKIVYRDDAQVVRLTAVKRYGDEETVLVTVESL